MSNLKDETSAATTRSHATTTRPDSGGGLSLRTITAPFSRFVERWMPAPLIFDVALTVIVAVMALTMTPAGPTEGLSRGPDGRPDLLALTTQMFLLLLPA